MHKSTIYILSPTRLVNCDSLTSHMTNLWIEIINFMSNLAFSLFATTQPTRPGPKPALLDPEEHSIEWQGCTWVLANEKKYFYCMIDVMPWKLQTVAMTTATLITTTWQQKQEWQHYTMSPSNWSKCSKTISIFLLKALTVWRLIYISLLVSLLFCSLSQNSF